jgi:hypothetical protein
MGTMASRTVLSDNLGVVPRVIKFMFDEISRRKELNPGTEFTLKVSYVEIYGETIRDLIEPLTSGWLRY